MTIYEDKHFRKKKDDDGAIPIGDEYNDNPQYGESEYETNDDTSLVPNRSIPEGETDGNREHLVAEEIDPYADYYKQPTPPIPSAFDTFKGTVRVTSSVTKGGSGNVLSSYRDSTSYSSDNSATGRSEGKGAVKPGVVTKGSSTDFSKFYKNNMSDLKRRGKLK